MAEWQRNSLADTGAFKQLAEQGEAAITTVQSVLQIVQGGAEVAKLFLTGIANPAAVAAAALADAIAASLNNYKESGYFLLIIDPTNDNYGQKLNSPFGLEMRRDENGDPIFYRSKVASPDSEFLGQVFRVNDSYRRSLNLADLDGTYRDRLGRMKDDEGFIPPTPRTIDRMVLGGYDPATWTGTQDPFSFLPQMPADKTIRLMAEAFDDEGDIPKFEVIETDLKTFGDKGESKVPFTKLGSPITEYDAHATFRVPLYASGNTSLAVSDRKLITRQIKSGRPNYLGDTSLTGQTITGLAFIIAAQNPTQFIDSLTNVLKLFPDLDPTNTLNNLKKAFEKLLTPDNRKITVRVDTRYGEFRKDDLIQGEASGAVGKLAENPVLIDTPVINKTEYTYKIGAYGSIGGVSKVTTNTNADGRYKEYQIEFTPLADPTNRFIPDEPVFEAETITKTFNDGTEYITYKAVGEEIKNSDIDNPAGVRLPKYGYVKGLNPIAPNSTPPDFISVKAADFIPGWADFFDGLIELANGIKGFAEGTSEFIQTLIDTIDDLLTKFTKLVNALTELITVLTTGLPNAGIWYLGMETSTGNDGFKSGLTSAGNAPDSSYVFSAGFLLVGDPVIKQLSGADPLKVLFEPLGVEFQSV